MTTTNDGPQSDNLRLFSPDVVPEPNDPTVGVVPEKPVITGSDGFYVFEFPKYQVRVTIDRVESRRDGDVGCEIEVEFLPTDEVIEYRSLNMLAGRSKTELTNALARHPSVAGHPADWVGIVNYVCMMTIKRYRQGDPPRVAGLDTTPIQHPNPYFLYPYLARSGGTILFGAGGVGKSTLAHLIAVVIATAMPNVFGHPRTDPTGVLVGDYEDDYDAHRLLLDQICGPLGVEVPNNIFYKHLTKPLHDMRDELRHDVRKHDLGYMIVDSLVPACGGGSEDAQRVNQMFMAARYVGVPFTGLAHITKDEANKVAEGDTSVLAPYGNIMQHNLARASTFANRIAKPGASEAQLILTSQKMNKGGKYATHAYKIAYQMDGEITTGITFARQKELAGTPAESFQSDQQRVLAAISNGTKGVTATEIAQTLGMVQALVTRRAVELIAAGKIVQQGERYFRAAPKSLERLS